MSDLCVISTGLYYLLVKNLKCTGEYSLRGGLSFVSSEAKSGGGYTLDRPPRREYLQYTPSFLPIRNLSAEA